MRITFTFYVSIFLISNVLAQKNSNYLLESIDKTYFDYFDGIKKTITPTGTTPFSINTEYHLSSGSFTYSTTYKGEKRVFMKGVLKNGKAHGQFVEYDLSTGKIKKRGQFDNGLLHGEVIEYNENAIFILEYQHGTLETKTVYQGDDVRILAGNFL